MGSRRIAAEERHALCDLFDEVGKDAPTLCGDWTTRDLAAHLIVRERRPGAGAGILLPALRGYTASVQDAVAQRPWPELVAAVREGPPRWSPLSVALFVDAVNAVEFFVHHEDVRRARAGWEPRPLDAGRDGVLWRSVRTVGRLSYRGSPVTIVLHRPGGAQHTVKRGTGTDTVTITGEPGELLLHAYGRDEVRVRFDGSPEDVATVRGPGRGL